MSESGHSARQGEPLSLFGQEPVYVAWPPQRGAGSRTFRRRVDAARPVDLAKIWPGTCPGCLKKLGFAGFLCMRWRGITGALAAAGAAS